MVIISQIVEIILVAILAKAVFVLMNVGGRVYVGDEDTDGEEITTCIFCRMEEATDKDLLNFLLRSYDLTRAQAFELYKKE